eukprot:5546205-Alexandrium_andersonii.AAC.1
MSASLVGSEMCIRDSDSSTVCTPSRSATARRRSTSAGSLSVFSRTRSVSYTHLTLPTICSV